MKMVVDSDDLRKLLDYAQPDEERDYEVYGEENPDEDQSGHIVHVIRRLRARLHDD